MRTLNQVYSSLAARRRYEVWFIRLALADGSGAGWFRYLLMNPGRSGCAGDPAALPVQVWATWFGAQAKPQTIIQGFPLQELDLSHRGQAPFHFRIAGNAMDEGSCRGRLQREGREISWDVRFSSTFRTTLSSKGWIGFSRTPHSDAAFSGEIIVDGRKFHGDSLGFGLQGHNCGYRHRNFWRWTHAFFAGGARASTLEALVYEMPLGLWFRKCVLWHGGKEYVFRKLREPLEREGLQWNFRCSGGGGLQLEALVDGRGLGVHRLPYLKTDCSGSFEVLNNSLAKAAVRLRHPDGRSEELQTAQGAVLEFGGEAAAL